MVNIPTMYSASAFGDEKMMRKFFLQVEDARSYFTRFVQPRLDRSYKLYTAYNGDRARQIQPWQSNVFIPYIHGVVETLMPRILDARPEFAVMARRADNQFKTTKLQNLVDYTWEISNMDDTTEIVTRSSLVYGTGYLQTSWKKDVRVHKFLKTRSLGDKNASGAPKKLEYEEREQTFYDAPFCEWVDNYSLWYDWHNIPRESKQFWFKRLVMTAAEVRRKYPLADPVRLELALKNGAQDLNYYGSIRNLVKFSHREAVRGADYGQGGFMSMPSAVYETNDDPELRMNEVFEWTRPYDDSFAVMVNQVPVLMGGEMPIPFDTKETPFIDIPYLKMPGEFEGVGIPLLLENPQLMLNAVKNQRLDAATMSIHKMWIVNPLANIEKKDLVVRPFGIVYTTDTNGVREVEFSDVKPSAYQEEELLKGDMRYASGVDDFSMGVGGGAGSATEVRHLRESTLERVRLFVNHIGDSYSKVMRHWLSMYRQFHTEDLTIRIVGDDGQITYPLIEKDDLMGEFDYKAAVKPSIAGKNDIDKKQGMDLFQLLINMPFIDPRKLTAKTIQSWGWALESVSKPDEPAPQPGMPGMVGPDGMPLPPPGPGPAGEPVNPLLMPAGAPMPDAMGAPPPDAGMSMGPSPFAEASAPINLLQGGGMPPTVGGTSNPRGMNRGAGVNTNLNMAGSYDPGKSLMNQSQNIQK